jgi:hypothetical protein
VPVQFTRKGRYRLSRDGTFISEHNVVEEAYENALEHAEDNGEGTYRVDPPWTEVDVPLMTILGATRSGGVQVGGSGGGGGAYAATHYVAPFASVAGASNDYDDLGATAWTNAASSGTPTTFGTALARAIAGNKVRCGAGTYTGPDTTLRWSCAFAPANSGSFGNPIIFFAENPAAYNISNPELWTILERVLDGGGVCLGFTYTSVSPPSNHCIFDGFACYEATTLAGASAGVLRLHGTGNEFRRVLIDRTDVLPYGGGYNGSAIYITSTIGCRVVDTYFLGNDTLSTQQDSAIEIYNSEDLIIEHIEGHGAGQTVHVKTEAPTDSGIMENVHVRYSILEGSTGVAGLTSQTSRSTFVYQNLIIRTGTGACGFRWTNTAEELDCQVQFYSNTVIGNHASGSGLGLFDMQGAIRVAAGTEFYNNIFINNNNGNIVRFPETGSWTIGDPDDFDRLDYNFYQQSSPSFYLNGTTHTSFANYQAAMASTYGLDAYGNEHEANSQMGTVTFVNEAGGDYHLADNGQAALTASTTGGPVGCYITGEEEIGLRASPTY